MFTGLIADIGKVLSVQPLNEGVRLRIATSFNVAAIDMGASIAHNGVCLTVVGKGGDWYEVEVWEEALRLSTLSSLKAGDCVNLERSLRVGDELGGHLVSGHVDGIAEIVDVKAEGDAVRFTLKAPQALARFIAQKGSVALDGTSLTVNGVKENRFDVLLIKHTLEVTTWGSRKVGDQINLEIDQIARYAERLSQFAGK